MNFNLISNLTVMILIVLMAFTSCTKENSVTLIEMEEELEFGVKMTINSTEIETNAVAAYCQNDTIEFFIISNKEELLVFPTSTQDFEEGDFVYFTSISENNPSWAYGGQALGSDITGFPGLSILYSDAELSIDSNNGNILIGSSSGTLIGFDSLMNFVPFPYEMNFVAEIVAESNYCE